MMSRSMLLRSSLALLCAFALGGCSTIKGWFGDGDKEKEAKAGEPAELTDITPSVEVAKLWSARAGKGEGRIGVGQRPAVADGRVYAAAIEGGVRALDLQTGKQVWEFRPEKKSGLRLSGGPGAGEGLVVVGGLDGEVIALDAASGEEKWRAEVPNEVIAPPAIGLGMVFVRSNDGRVTAFDAATGERRWFWTQDVPPLSVRGNDAPVLGPGFVFVGNDDGTVTALAANDGRPLWDQAVAQPEGRTELDRMADIDGTPVLEGTTLYATSFKNATLAIDAPSGRPMWNSGQGGVGRLGVAADRLIVTDRTGTVYALDKATGSALWSQPALLNRKVSAPAVQGDYAVVADYDGYVHWLKLENGEFAARERAGGEAVKAAPVVADGVLLVQNVDGELTAFKLQ
ncbi:outer membrane protein assembly factor BamB [Vulcaniibacterium tengchongense]|uniref:Outer membrane protein assembly factor BamB n=1 Tax=Vulcaniibacterium tengchongense TaxID=1273429 RepID=A0A3N4VFC5_9GAMM|nr:outer membrane protein assembly factor BamB [Vulcaniibacterium tengchongense]RPE81702.1 Beta-barrel assembly machine subunit BamB [Vulcaniibacterium tengchongense]